MQTRPALIGAPRTDHALLTLARILADIAQGAPDDEPVPHGTLGYQPQTTQTRRHASPRPSRATLASAARRASHPREQVDAP